MATLPKMTKAKLLGLIDDLKNNPNDKLRILGDAGIVSMVIVVGTPTAASAVIHGVTSLFGLSAAAHLFGWMAAIGIGGSPLALIVGCASLLGLLAFAITRLVYGGGLAEGRKAELLEKYRSDVKIMEAKEESGSITDMDRTQFILSLRELINKDAIPINDAFKMIELVEQGRIPLSQASSMIQACLATKL